MKLNIVTLAIATVGLFLFAVHVSGLPWTPAHIAGAAIALPSFLLVVVARMQLGRAFSVTAKASTLVTTGLYSRIRNLCLFGSADPGHHHLDRPAVAAPGFCDPCFLADLSQPQ